MADIGLYLPTDVRFGKGIENEVGEVLKEKGAHKVLIHYGSGSIKKSGLYDKVVAALDAAGIEHVELGGVVPNPRVSLARKGIELCEAEGVDCLLAVGGGSVLDSTKCIAYGLYANAEARKAGEEVHDVWDFYCGKRKPAGAFPFGAILTLSATGSEMSDSSVITNDDGEPTYKRGVNSDFGRPDFALLDPELTYSVSKYQTASGSVDIMMHTLERYFHSGYALDFTDELSFAVLKTIVKYAPVALEKPDDYDARANLMWAGTLSHNGLMASCNSNKGDWACHQMEHELSAEYDVAHGAGLAAIWGSWARYVMDVDIDRFVKLGRGVWGYGCCDSKVEELTSDEKKDLAEKTIAAFEEFFKSLDMPISVPELIPGFDEEACKVAALGVTFQNARTIGSYKVLATEDIFEIYKAACGL